MDQLPDVKDFAKEKFTTKLVFIHKKIRNLENLTLRMSNLSRLAPDEYYINEQGYVVFTEVYLLKRGYCCDNGCKHCPYTYRQKKLKLNRETKNEQK